MKDAPYALGCDVISHHDVLMTFSSHAAAVEALCRARGARAVIPLSVDDQKRFMALHAALIYKGLSR